MGRRAEPAHPSGARCHPRRGEWHERLVALMGLPVVQAVEVRGDRLFVLERDAGAQQARLVGAVAERPAAGRRVLADPAADAARRGLGGRLVLRLARRSSWWRSGSARAAPRTRCCGSFAPPTGRCSTTRSPNCRACSVGWEPDGSGFCYTRYPEGDEYNRTVHHHTLGDRLAPTTRSCGTTALHRRRGRTSACRPTGVTCWSTPSSGGAAPTCTCSIATCGAVAHADLRRRSRQRALHVRRRAHAGRHDHARRPAPPGRAHRSRPPTRSALARGRRSSPRATRCSAAVGPVARRAVSSRPPASASTAWRS